MDKETIQIFGRTLKRTTSISYRDAYMSEKGYGPFIEVVGWSSLGHERWAVFAQMNEIQPKVVAVANTFEELEGCLKIIIDRDLAALQALRAELGG